MPRTPTVATRAALLEALGEAQDGDTILLAAGRYGALHIAADAAAALPRNLELRAADPAAPARFGGLALQGVAGLTLHGLTFDYRAGPRNGACEPPFTLRNCSDITIRDAVFEGNINPATPRISDCFGIGLSLQDCAGIRLENSALFNFDRGIVGLSLRDLHLCGNDLHMIASAGMEFADVDGAVIEGNHLHDFWHAPTAMDQPDMIQFCATPRHPASRRIAIRDNWLDIGHGGASRSILVLAEVVAGRNAGTAIACKGLVVEGNMILNADFHGVVVDRAEDVVLRKNVLLHAAPGTNRQDRPWDMGEVPRIIVAADAAGVEIEDNATAAVDGPQGQAGWVVRRNAFIRHDDTDTAGLCRDALLAAARMPGSGRSAREPEAVGLPSPAATAPRSTAPAPAANPGAQTANDEKEPPAGTGTAPGTGAADAGPDAALSGSVAQLPPLILEACHRAATIPLSEVETVLRSPAFRIDMTLQAMQAVGDADVVRLHRSFAIRVTPGGELQVRMFCRNGDTVDLTSEGAGLLDGAEHRVSVRVGGRMCRIWIDGLLLAEAPMPRRLKIVRSHPLLFGDHGMSAIGPIPRDFRIVRDRMDDTPAAIPAPDIAARVMLAAGSDAALGDRFEFLL